MKNYGQSGVASDVELGKGGDKLSSQGTHIEVQDNAGALQEMRGKAPSHDDAFVTKRYFDIRASVVVSGQINGGTPPAVVNGEVYVVTTTGGAYTVNELYRGESGVWVQIPVFENMNISVSQSLTGGAVEFLTDSIYTWDLQGTAWNLVGPATALVGLMKHKRVNRDFNSGPISTIMDAIAGDGITKIVVNVTQAFNGTTPEMSIGDSANNTRLMDVSEVDLGTVGVYVVEPYWVASGSTAVNTYLTLTGATAGQCTVDAIYGIA